MTVENKAPVLTNEAIEAKVKSGQALNTEEREFIKGNPNLEDGAKPAETAEEPEEDRGEVAEDGEEAAPEEGAEETAEEGTPAPTPKPGEKKKETPAPNKPADRKALIEAELAKPASQQDLSKFTESEIGTFIDLKKQRLKNKKLQEENDGLKFELLKKGLKPGETAVEEEGEEDPLDGIGEEDVITGKELKKILQRTAKKPAAKEPAPGKQITPDVVAAQEVTAKTSLEARGLKDYDEVSQYVQYALYDDPDAPALLRDAAEKGENIAEVAYFMVKGSKKWPQIKGLIEAEKARKGLPAGKPPVKKDPPPAENRARADRFEQNSGKVRTTGAGAGGGEESGEYTAQDVQAMTTEEFRLLPRETRDKILKKFGSEPNMSR